MKLNRIELRYWDYCIVDNFEAAISKDGLLFMFNYSDIEHILSNYKQSEPGIWLFPNGDREIAETASGNRVTVNPQFVYSNFDAASIII